MKISHALLPVLCAGITITASAQDDVKRVAVPGELAVCFETAADGVTLDDRVDGWKLDRVVRGFALDGARRVLHWTPPGAASARTVAIIDFPNDVDSAALIAHLETLDGVVWASPHYAYVGDPRELEPNDPQYGAQYHHPLMQNNDAWDMTLGDSDVIIAVTDDGVDLDHEDLQANIWVNPGEIPGNGVDDDGNGYIDDVNGWDVLHNNNDPNPQSAGNDHGTHVAGISAAKTDNGIGVAGTAGDSTIMAIQWYTSGTSGWTAEVIAESFAYAVDNGARIINTSYNINGWVGDPVVIAGFQYLYDMGGLHFNSAGNGAEANPARQAFHQTFLTISTDSTDAKSSFSNWGTGCDLCAPGSSVLSTEVNNTYGTKSGTSMAAPNACGVAALVWAQNPDWNRDQVAAQVLGTCDNIDAQNPAYVGMLGAGRVNSYRALTETLPAPCITSIVGLPGDGTHGTIPDNTFTMRFSQVMSPPTMNDADAFTMIGAGPDGEFDTADDTTVDMTWTNYMVATNEVVFEVTGDFIHGLYRFRADAGVITNPFGAGLDTNCDGTPGDSFESTFWYVSACAPDLNGDNEVNVSDLILMLSNFGTPGPGDINGDGIVNSDDLLMVLAGWGSCITGACCLPDGTCVEVTEATCATLGGDYLADNSTCDTAGCNAAENDLCVNSIAVEDGDYAFTTVDAATDGPQHPSCEFDGQTYHDIWYTYTAPASGNLNVSLCDQANYDTDLVIYDGCDCGALVLLACDDDTSGCGGFTSEIDVTVTAGNCYMIRVGGWNDGDQGTGTMSVDGP